MRTTNERIEELNRRVKKCEAQRRTKRTVLLSLCGCFLLISGFSSTISHLLKNMPIQNPLNAGLAASLFAENNLHGFIIVGAFAFLLGVCVTMLCYKLKNRTEKDEEDDNG